MSTSKERYMFVAKIFIFEVVDKHNKHPVSSYGVTWYPQAYKFKAKRHVHSFYEASIIERTIQYIKNQQNVLLFSM